MSLRPQDMNTNNPQEQSELSWRQKEERSESQERINHLLSTLRNHILNLTDKKRLQRLFTVVLTCLLLEQPPRIQNLLYFFSMARNYDQHLNIFTFRSRFGSERSPTAS